MLGNWIWITLGQRQTFTALDNHFCRAKNRYRTLNKNWTKAESRRHFELSIWFRLWNWASKPANSQHQEQRRFEWNRTNQHRWNAKGEAVKCLFRGMKLTAQVNPFLMHWTLVQMSITFDIVEEYKNLLLPCNIASNDFPGNFQFFRGKVNATDVNQTFPSNSKKITHDKRFSFNGKNNMNRTNFETCQRIKLKNLWFPTTETVFSSIDKIKANRSNSKGISKLNPVMWLKFTLNRYSDYHWLPEV